MQRFNKMKIMAAAWLICMFLMIGANPVYAAGSLSIAVSSNNVKAGDNVTVTVYAVNSDNAEVTSDMTITYDSAKLEYVSSSAGSASGGNGTVKVTGSTVDLKFKARTSGDAYVKAEGATLTAAGAHINVTGSSSETDDSTATAASGDNSLSSLKLSAGTLSPVFKGSVTSYTAKVGKDVDSITVTPTTANSKAVVESITGNDNLKDGENVISVVVKAENGTKATYKITVTKSDSVTTTTEDTKEEEKLEETTTDAETTVDAESSSQDIEIDGVIYHISEEIPEEEIPEGFALGNFEYKGVRHKGLTYELGHMGLYYLVNEAGESSFFVYDADRDGFYPYVRLTNGEHFIILIVVQNGAVPPDDYQKTTVEINGVTVPAYQYYGKDVEIVQKEGEELAEGSTGSDFYLLYAMDSEGVAGWYQYDKVQGTYQRLNSETKSEVDETANYETLLESYNSLDNRYNELKTKNRRVIAVLIFLTVVLLIVVINLVLRGREEDDDDEDDFEETPKKTPRRREVKEVSKPAAKPIPKQSAPVGVHTRLKEEESAAFYDGDDADIMAEFEDEPSVLSRRPKMKEKPEREVKAPVKKSEPSKEQPVSRTTSDDDIEFLDLNDL